MSDLWSPPITGSRVMPRKRLRLSLMKLDLMVTLAETVAHLRLDPGAESGPEQPLLERMIRAATAHVEHYCSCAVRDQNWEMTLWAFPLNGDSIIIPRPPLIEILEFSAFGNPLDPADYRIEDDDRLDAQLWPTSGWWPSIVYPTPGAVLIRFRCGYQQPASVPEPIRQAILSAVATWYENRESLQMFTLQPVIEVGWRDLLAPYRSAGFA